MNKLIKIKSQREIELLREAGHIVYQTHQYLKKYIKPGVTTKELNDLAEKFILEHDAYPSFKGFEGFPSAICASINHEVVHGIPSNTKLKNGDIIGQGIIRHYLITNDDKASGFRTGGFGSTTK